MFFFSHSFYFVRLFPSDCKCWACARNIRSNQLVWGRFENWILAYDVIHTKPHSGQHQHGEDGNDNKFVGAAQQSWFRFSTGRFQETQNFHDEFLYIKAIIFFYLFFLTLKACQNQLWRQCLVSLPYSMSIGGGKHYYTQCGDVCILV